jgi:hypothetical protein
MSLALTAELTAIRTEHADALNGDLALGRGSKIEATCVRAEVGMATSARHRALGGHGTGNMLVSKASDSVKQYSSGAAIVLVVVEYALPDNRISFPAPAIEPFD